MKFGNRKGKKNINILQSFKNKKFRYGSYATLVTLIVLAALIVVNLAADLLPVRIDLTTNKMYSLSEQTENVLDNLDKDVTIYFIGEPGTGNVVIEENVQRYARLSDHIRIDYIDPVRDPLTAQKYTKDGGQLSYGNLLVEQGEVFRIISQYDMYNFSQNQNTGERKVESLAVEQRLTSAILYVSGADMPVAYQLDGHGEASINYATTKQMELENFVLESLNLLGMDEVPEDADLLIINGPQRDLSAEELTVIQDYLENNGKAIFMMDLLISDLPNFQTLFNTYGIQMSNALVIEGEQGRYIGGNPLYVLPQFGSHEIVNPIKSNSMPLIMPGVQGIEVSDNTRNTLTIEPLLTTSDQAYGRSADSEGTSMEKQEGDLSGPFSLAVAIEDRVYNLSANETYTARMVVIGSSSFLNT
ncbi:MAG TPA: ABC transporter, partial [Clostridiales bacterium]|nr:ABC transporter [Clostridiales bacterium]